ncbi:hypothetical protein FA13DRAFT_1852982 [Coprinellus micaceus]|uniref:Uncharacterized protein n=1 Tax=Coprinellus micaceus TaxID=71717 RepID=A0A4Y7SC36_COPMI|nr:hypothetical protein FA13DRAFT_1852982 [Coprinellus micaceus]
MPQFIQLWTSIGLRGGASGAASDDTLFDRTVNWKLWMSSALVNDMMKGACNRVSWPLRLLSEEHRAFQDSGMNVVNHITHFFMPWLIVLTRARQLLQAKARPHSELQFWRQHCECKARDELRKAQSVSWEKGPARASLELGRLLFFVLCSQHLLGLGDELNRVEQDTDFSLQAESERVWPASINQRAPKFHRTAHFHVRFQVRGAAVRETSTRTSPQLKGLTLRAWYHMHTLWRVPPGICFGMQLAIDRGGSTENYGGLWLEISMGTHPLKRNERNGKQARLTDVEHH